MSSTPPGPRVLIVEDEPAMRRALEDCCRQAGYRVMSASDGQLGLDKATEEQPDLIVLDVMLPRLDGFSVCETLRRAGCRAAVLLLTAKGQWADRVKGLDLGADDYLVKPFRSEELLARLRALLRRQQRALPSTSGLRLADTTIDFARQTATRGRKPLHLTPKEFAMLRLLSENDGEAVSRERFLDVVWGYAAFPTTRTVDNHIASLRQKLEPDPGNPRWILTVSGVGYRLEIAKAPAIGSASPEDFTKR
ncbi:MAG: response regulator transcription factor [Verrucomicrobia bacterium]|nr:response regulator transcription factor [Verrucomicrobiota bacterium]MBI3870710.1 response regulator transcription factor [Verrucomicrobiota bacterium]